MKLSNIIPAAVTALVVLAGATTQNANAQVVFEAPLPPVFVPVPTVILPPPPVVVPEFTPLPIVPFVPVVPEFNPCFPRLEVFHHHPFFIPRRPIFLRR